MPKLTIDEAIKEIREGRMVILVDAGIVGDLDAPDRSPLKRRADDKHAGKTGMVGFRLIQHRLDFHRVEILRLGAGVPFQGRVVQLLQDRHAGCCSSRAVGSTRGVRPYRAGVSRVAIGGARATHAERRILGMGPALIRQRTPALGDHLGVSWMSHGESGAAGLRAHSLPKA